MKLFQTILLSVKSSKPSSEIAISIEPMEKLLNIFTVVVKGQELFRLNVTEMEQKFPDFAVQLKLKANSDQVIEINDVELEVYGLMHKFVCDDKKPSKAEMKKYAVKLLEATNEYKIDPLKQICDSYLSNARRKADSAIDHLIIALANEAPMLTSSSFRDVNFNYRKVKDNQKWLDLVKARPTIYKELYISLYRVRQKWFNSKSMKTMALQSTCLLCFVYCLLGTLFCIIWTLVSLPIAIWSYFY